MAGVPPVSIGSTAAVTELDGSVLRVHLLGDYGRAISLAADPRPYVPGAVGEPFSSTLTK
ncbi:hypothetical protein CN147_34015 [Sinorhizobium meliloti]|nr:hypothetical protein CN147_34015 [Sinorhizobium meliloti]